MFLSVFKDLDDSSFILSLLQEEAIIHVYVCASLESKYVYFRGKTGETMGSVETLDGVGMTVLHREANSRKEN